MLARFSRLRNNWQLVTFSILFTQETFSFVPSSYRPTNNVISSFSFSLAHEKLSLKNDDCDDAIVPSSKNDNATKVTKRIEVNVKALQQQYEALFVSDPTATTDESSSSSFPSKAKSDIDRGSSSQDEQKSNHQEFELNCGISPDLISILKEESLWSNDTYTAHVPPILTSTERKRRLLEIELLQNLIQSGDDDDDETVDQLWSLWYAERDNEDNATEQLYAATLYTNDPNTWDQAEQIMRQLILKHGIFWVEPVNRLATLYYLQGKYQQSINLCRVILHVKPWHFGALSGMVGLYIQMNDMAQAKKWSEKRLPSYVPDFLKGSKNSNQRRAEWVKNAVTEAKLSLHNAEQHLQTSFGKRDPRQPLGRYYNDHHNSTNDTVPTMLDTDAGSWQ